MRRECAFVTLAVMLIGAPAAAACNQEDYMTPAELAELAPWQRDGSGPHDHGAPATAAPVSETQPGSDPVEAAPAPEPAAPAPTEDAAVTPVEERSAATPVRTEAGRETAARDQSRTRQPAPAPAAPVAPAQLATPVAMSTEAVIAPVATPDDQDVATRRRRAARRAAERERTARAVRRVDLAARRAASPHAVADPAARLSIVTAERAGPKQPARAWPALVALPASLLILGGLAFLARARRRTPVDEVEAALQELIAEQRARESLAEHE
jgi:hypothetical protein